jgi:hypothetical protein
MTNPDIVVLIPTRNRPVEFATTLAGVAATTPADSTSGRSFRSTGTVRTS